MSPRNTAGGIILNTEGKIVLVGQNQNSWAFPKGAIERGETVLQAALREIKEETGLRADDLTLVEQLPSYVRYSIDKDGTGEDMSRPPSTRALFLFKTEKNELKPEDAEITDIRWVTIDEALALLTHPKDREFIQNVRDKIEK
ncbi:MAG: NUDIX hydrolase [bacterium]|nr:NUDIX hydrolase [bacterium]